MIAATRTALLVSMLAAVPLGAYAQQPANQPGTQQNKLQIERIKSGFVIAPDVRFGRINDRNATFAGAYGGWMTEQTLLVGAGGYWLANNSRDFKMAYGGGVVEWFIRGDRHAGLSARGLVGGGRATLSNTYGHLLDLGAHGFGYFDEMMRFGRGHDVRGRFDWPMPFDPTRLSAARVAYSDDFFIAEPQINGFVKVTDWLRFNAGVGYRVIGGTSAPNMDERLRGLSGSIAVVLGGS